MLNEGFPDDDRAADLPDALGQVNFNGSRGGETFDHGQDYHRLNAQQLRVAGVMGDSQWRTLSEISEQIGDPEASVSARLRDFRKPEFGGFTVLRRRRGGKGGLWEYRLTI